MGLVTFVALVLAAGLGGYALLVALGHDEGEAWAAGRTVGLVAVVFPAWWAGALGVSSWRLVGFGLLLAVGAVGAAVAWRRRAAWRSWLRAEAVMLTFALFVLWIRLGQPQILGTEKPMDLGILATLQRATGFPPPDMWLAGETLPYYYWGALVWAVPLAFAPIALEVGYNVIVAVLAGLSAGLVWALGSRLGGSRRAGWAAAAAVVAAGTPDGLRQLVAGRPLGGLDMWGSSRQVADTITEWPLFTFWLGDLHPHLLALPLALAAVVAAARAADDRLRPVGLLVAAVLFGVTWAANPWAMPPTLAGVALVVLVGRDGLSSPTQAPWRWLAIPAIAAVGWLAVAPFHLEFAPPFQGLGWVHAWTPPLDLMLWGGGLLAPAILAAYAALRDGAGTSPERSRAVALAAVAVALGIAAVSARPTLVLVGVACIVMATVASGAGAEPRRQAVAFAALGLFLIAVPEVLYVRDPYGEALHRMNTVFKAYFMGWVMLSLAFPTLLARAARGRTARTVLVAAVLAGSLGHPLGAVKATFSAGNRGVDGLRWMSAGDRRAVEWLRGTGPGTTLVEAVGGAYSEYARLSAASGVPALLGWGNHEGVWRGAEVGPELERRKRIVDGIYSSGDPDQVRRLVAEAGVDLVAVGTLERRDYAADALTAVIDAGEVVFAWEETQLVRFTREGRTGG